MPLSEIQTGILRLLASNIGPDSYIVGATTLNQHGPRVSADIDILYDHEAAVARAADADTAGPGNRILPRWAIM